MRIVSFGFQTWGVKTLQALVDLGHDVALSVTHPASDDSYKGIFADSVEELARSYGIPVHLTERVDHDTIDLVKRAEPDVIVVNSWYTWMPPELYNLPPHGTLNLHDSLLPKFTGFSPVIWAMISGATEVGLTAHRMDDELDTGDIVLQRSIPIGPKDTGTSLVRATIELIPDVLIESLDLIEQGTATWTPQNLDERTFFHKRSARDSIVDWRWTAEDLDRFVRALSDPYPNAVTYWRGQRIRILRASVSRCCYGGTPGRVFIAEGDGMVIVAGPNAHRGDAPGLVVEAVRHDDGTEQPPREFFGRGRG